MISYCVVCSAEFECRARNHIYCSSVCRNKVSTQQRLEARQSKHRICPVCSNRFVPSIQHRVCCSAGCMKIRRAKRFRGHKPRVTATNNYLGVRPSNGTPEDDARYIREKLVRKHKGVTT